MRGTWDSLSYLDIVAITGLLFVKSGFHIVHFGFLSGGFRILVEGPCLESSRGASMIPYRKSFRSGPLPSHETMAERVRGTHLNSVR